MSKTYLVLITIPLPYPKTEEFRITASGIRPAVARAIGELRKRITGRKISEMVIKVKAL